MTGDLLRVGPVPVTELRAAVIVGSGSASFEMLRHVTEKLPIMVCPRWIMTRTQPIFIDDVLAYLIAALETPETEGRILDIGGLDVLSFRDMMLTYANVKNIRRIILTVPMLTPRLSAYWVNLMTPIPASIAFPLIEGLRTETVCENDDARRLMPFPLTSFREAVERSLQMTEELAASQYRDDTQQGTVPEVFDPALIPLRDLLLNRHYARIGVRTLSQSLRNPHQLSTKICPVCLREFTWRKKWERTWDQVRYCSDKCRSQKRPEIRYTDGK